ncbi:MAG: hypothetical protein WDO24_24395 [Pseudomonadota bacterium]
MIEAKLNPTDRGYVAVGQSARVKISDLRFRALRRPRGQGHPDRGRQQRRPEGRALFPSDRRDRGRAISATTRRRC